MSSSTAASISSSSISNHSNNSSSNNNSTKVPSTASSMSTMSQLQQNTTAYNGTNGSSSSALNGHCAMKNQSDYSALNGHAPSPPLLPSKRGAHSIANGHALHNGTTTTDPTSPTGEGEEDRESEVYLDHCQEGNNGGLMVAVNSLRKQGQFCDITLVVEDHEMDAHKAVLAASSPFLFDFLSCLEEGSEPQPIYKLKDVAFRGFQYLLDFMYTGRLNVPLSDAPVVYGTALVLKMESAARVCAQFLGRHLTAANCLGIRRFSKDSELRTVVDEYIEGNLQDIMECKSFFGLRNLQVEVVGLDETITDRTMERLLVSLVLDWAKKNLNDLKPKLDLLTEQVNVLYLSSDNTLMDCADIEDAVLSSDDDVVMDYKKMVRRRSKTVKAANPMANGNGGSHPFHKFSINPEEAVSVAEREWSIIATHKTNENTFISIAVLDGHLMAVSLHVRTQLNDSNSISSDQDSPDSSVSGSTGRAPSPMLRKTSIMPMETMSTARCAMGAVAMNGQLVVAGGYDRGECLQSVESFNIKENIWTSLPFMKAARGRFGAAVLDGEIYTCGGSDGWKELFSVEKYNPETKEWKPVARMSKERSSHGVATLGGKLYCIGGCEGQRSIATCEVYDPKTNTWSQIASLNIARSQTCVCTTQGMLFAIGGTDLWNTLNSVEVYSVEQDEWMFSSNLNIARRGAAVELINGTMVVVGGSDGAQSLTSTEFYDFDMNTWVMGPPMIMPRANLSAVTIGSRLFAVGGFSGKKFLNSLEWFDMDSNEWFGYTPRCDVEGAAVEGTKKGEELEK